MGSIAPIRRGNRKIDLASAIKHAKNKRNSSRKKGNASLAREWEKHPTEKTYVPPAMGRGKTRLGLRFEV